MHAKWRRLELVLASALDATCRRAGADGDTNDSGSYSDLCAALALTLGRPLPAQAARALLYAVEDDLLAACCSASRISAVSDL